jgi:hypothetical protein
VSDGLYEEGHAFETETHICTALYSLAKVILCVCVCMCSVCVCMCVEQEYMLIRVCVCVPFVDRSSFRTGPSEAPRSGGVIPSTYSSRSSALPPFWSGPYRRRKSWRSSMKT